MNKRKKRIALAAGMTTVVVGLGSLASVSCADADAASATGFSDNFEDGDTAGWSKSGGTWSVVTDGSHVLKQAKTGATLARQFAGLTDWTDYAVSAKVEPLSVASDGYAAIVA